MQDVADATSTEYWTSICRRRLLLYDVASGAIDEFAMRSIQWTGRIHLCRYVNF